MDRAHIVLVVLPIFLFCRDIFTLFQPRPPKPTQYHYHQIADPDEPPDPDPQTEEQQILQEPLKFPVQVSLSLSNPIISNVYVHAYIASSHIC